MSFFNTKEIAFGLDISDQTLRLVQFFNSNKKNKLQLYNEISLPNDCIINGEIKQEAIFIDNLKKLIKTKHGNGTVSKKAIIVLPETETFLKTISITCENPNDLENLILESINKNIPLESEEIYRDWQVVKQTENEYQVLIAASPKKIIDDYSNIFKQAGIISVVMEPEAASISRLLIEKNNDQEPKIIIDIGKNRTGMFLYDNDSIKFASSLPISGEQIDLSIMESLELNKDQAEKAKLICGLDRNKCQGAILEVLKPTIEELITKINSGLDFYYQNYSQAQEIRKIILCGGGANTQGIITTIKEATNIETELSEPFRNIKNPNINFFTPEKSQSFITSIGLGLRGLESSTFYDHN